MSLYTVTKKKKKTSRGRVYSTSQPRLFGTRIAREDLREKQYTTSHDNTRL